MPEPIIEVENLSKLYRLGVIGTTTLHESIERCWYRIRGKEEQLQKVGTKKLMIAPDDPQAGPEPNSIWALKDVSFSVQEGEIVGIIGKNGAGKSTLLKILTRITEPTSGRAIIDGRVASLLEVGTGFHSELTGRENVYLNGAILGMRKAEIDTKFDEIVEFSGIENFIDTPVKRYSSGMYVRLAFAVAAHLEPEILLVDEVLAVGDAEFQKKCLGKMKEVSEGGRTVLFVSHNMSSIRQLCSRVILVFKGEIKSDGDADTITAIYEKEAWGDADKLSAIKIRKPAPNHYHLSKVELRDINGEQCTEFEAGDTMKIHIWASEEAPATSFTIEFGLFNEQRRLISFGGANPVTNTYFKINDKHFVSRLGPLPLTSGKYWFDFSVRIWGQERWDTWENAIGFRITKCDLFRTGHDVPNGPGGDFIINQRWIGIEK